LTIALLTIVVSYRAFGLITYFEAA